MRNDNGDDEGHGADGYDNDNGDDSHDKYANDCLSIIIELLNYSYFHC